MRTKPQPSDPRKAEAEAEAEARSLVLSCGSQPGTSLVAHSLALSCGSQPGTSLVLSGGFSFLFSPYVLHHFWFLALWSNFRYSSFFLSLSSSPPLSTSPVLLLTSLETPVCCLRSPMFIVLLSLFPCPPFFFSGGQAFIYLSSLLSPQIHTFGCPRLKSRLTNTHNTWVYV